MAGIIDGAELGQEPARLGKGAGWGWGQPRETGGIGHTPGGQLQRQRREVGLLELGRALRDERPVLLPAPDTQAQART